MKGDKAATPPARYSAVLGGAIMKNPFASGGLLDKAMPYISFVVSINLLVQGVRLYLRGSTILWALAAGVVFFNACFGMYRQLQQRRLAREPK